MKRALLLLLPLFLFSCNRQAGNHRPETDPFRIVAPVADKFQSLPFGAISPQGWIREQMQKDMQCFVGQLDELVPGLMGDSIYGKNRLSRKIQNKDVGNVTADNKFDVQYLWWNSETQSNWRDGFIRNALLLGDSNAIRRVNAYVRYILSTQDSDGYLGIYARDLRYHYTGENGELWSKTTLLRGLLAYYEYTGDTAVLKAIQNSIADLALHYPAGNSSPFKSKDPVAIGVAHGLAITDVFDRLYQLTRQEFYRRYALFLYGDYSSNKLSEQDAQYANIMDTSYHLQGHGVHTYEHLRALTLAYYASGNSKLKEALRIYLGRIERELTPAGGPVGDEWIGGRTADASQTGYEYCSFQELLNGYTNLLQKSGEARFADLTERIFFNAAQGSRNPHASCIAYCKTDNSYEMTGSRNGRMGGTKKEIRYKYSPAHQDVAVCCVPNAGRITPYFVQSMWMREADSLVAVLFGPNQLHTTINGRPIGISEETNYPFSQELTFTVAVPSACTFGLKIRIPGWCHHFSCSLPYVVNGSYITISRTWKNGDRVRMNLDEEPVLAKDGKGQSYFTCGPLVFALPFKSIEMKGRTYAPGFTDLLYKRTDSVHYELHGVPSMLMSQNLHPEGTWDQVEMKVSLFNFRDRKTGPVTLVPIGATVLRQVTFERRK